MLRNSYSYIYYGRYIRVKKEEDREGGGSRRRVEKEDDSRETGQQRRALTGKLPQIKIVV
jgi:hypothetical protein